jgi:moderate conductance mechanosensitive channel
MEGAAETLDRVGGPILLVLVIALGAYLLLRLVGRMLIPSVMRRVGGEETGDGSPADIEKRKRVATIGALVDWLFRLLIVGGAVIAILVVLDLELIIVAILLVVAVIALVAKDVIRDYVAGVIILLENQFAIGDWIAVGQTYGEVEVVSLRRTLLRTMGGDSVSIPNGDIRTVTNRTRDWARINMELGLADASQVGTARDVIDTIGQELADDPVLGPAVLEAPRFMSVTAIGADGVRVLIWGRVRAADRFGAEGVFRGRLLAALSEAGIDLVTAQRVQVSDSARASS